MRWDRNKLISTEEIQVKVTNATVEFAKEFGEHLAKEEYAEAPMTTSQLRKFFGEVKRQQLIDFDSTKFAMLKPKLAYAVGRAKQNAKKKNNQYQYQKIEDFYVVMEDAIDKVLKSSDKDKAFRNFTTAFEAIVAYHKASEKK